MQCPNCGVENPEGSRFCMSCASPLVAPAAAVEAIVPPLRSALRRHRQPHEDAVGLLGFAFVLIGLAVVAAQNANLAGDLLAWTNVVFTQNTIFVRPPDGIILSAAWFFAIVGALEFVAASLRWALRWTRFRVAGRVLSGVGDLVFSALLVLYYGMTITGTFLLAILAGTVGALLIVYVTLGIYWASAPAPPYPERVQPPAQE